MIRLPAAIHFCAIAALAFPLGAQVIAASTLSIAGIVRGSDGKPLPYGTASLRETGAERFSNEQGEFVLANLAPGTYHLRVKQLGFVAFDTAIVLVAGRLPSRLEIALSPIAFRLATVTIKGSQACLAPDSVVNSDFQTIIAELRKNADRERLLVTSYPFEYRLTKRFETLSAQAVPRWGKTDTLAYRSDQRPRYAPGKVVRADPTRTADTLIMTIPALEDIGDPEFLRNHCFRYLGTRSDRGGTTHRIDFKPVQSVRTPDIEGSVFLDSRSYVIRRAIFRLTEGRQLNPPVQELEVTTSFREVFPGVTIIERVESVQRVTSESYSIQTVRLTERQKLVDVRFLEGQPGDTLHKK